MSAPAVVRALKILSQKDKIRLAEAKEIAYKVSITALWSLESFLERVQEHDQRGRCICVCRVRRVGYFMERVMARDQWYLDYDEPSWSRTEFVFFRTFFFFFLFSDACFFVGCWCVPLAAWWVSILVILFSDINSHRSTFVLGGSVDGSKPGPLGITPDQMTDEYIFCNGPFPLLFPLNSQRPAFSSTSITNFYPFKR